MSYQPRKEAAAALDRGYELVQSVPYDVSARWVFYQLLQEGYYSHKLDYKRKFLPAVSKARHEGYGRWRPNTLADDTREATHRGGGWDNPKDWIDHIVEDTTCLIDKWNDQEYYVELWFEARAMASQFEYLTKHMTLRPMAGQPSIPFKYQIARELGYYDRKYGNPIQILYFGDLDPGGDTIAWVVERDVRKWCPANFDFTFCGLTHEQVTEWDVPENPEKFGFQWEALSPEGAEEIINEATDPYVDHDLFEEAEDLEDETTKRARASLQPIADEWDEDE